MNVPRSTVLDVLTEDNYANWEVCMKNYLIGKGLWDIVDGTEPQPDPQNSPLVSIKKWKKRNGKALHAIQVSCGPKIFSCISKELHAKDAWSRLASIQKRGQQ